MCFALGRAFRFQLLNDLLSGIRVELDEVVEAFLRLAIQLGGLSELQ